MSYRTTCRWDQASNRAWLRELRYVMIVGHNDHREQSNFRPKLFDCLAGYTSAQFFADLVAGVTVGIVALPLAMAFAIASGVKPEAGIFTAVIAGFIISALGGSRVQIGDQPALSLLLSTGLLPGTASPISPFARSWLVSCCC